MPRKLTIIGVIAALVLGMVGLAQSASANDAQSFCVVGHNAAGTCPAGFNAIDWDICYDTTGNGTGTPPSSIQTPITCGAGTSDSAIAVGTAGVARKEWTIISSPIGSRLTLPVTYTPAAFGHLLPATNLTVKTGDVTSRVDLLCNGGADILARNQTTTSTNGGPIGRDPSATLIPAGGSGVWPGNGWEPFNFYRGSVTDPNYLYIDQIKPMPFQDVSLDVSRLVRLWLGGTISIDIAPVTPSVPDVNLQGTPLVVLDTASKYATGLHVSVAILGGSPSPPNNQYLCLDSPGDSIATNLETIPPTVAGNYVRWQNQQSAADIVSGQVTRLMIVRCVNVGGAAGTCDLADNDGDGVPNAVEAVNGTDPNSADTDADGATDFHENFQFSDPGCLVAGVGSQTCATPAGRPLDTRDTDADGSWDLQDDLSGLNCGNTINLTCVTTNNGDLPATGAGSDDNCPVNINPTQLNTDSQFDFTNTPNVPAGTIARADATNPHQDHEGDACDRDDDNDGLADVTEAGFLHTNLAPGSAGGPPVGSLWCLPVGATDPGGGIATVATDPLNPDFDSDGGLDGRECQFGSDPLGAGTSSCSPTCSGLNRFPSALSLGQTDGDGDLLFPDAAETFYRTQHINQGSAAALDDIEQLPCATPFNCAFVPDGKVGPADNDSDGDHLNDGVEVKWYATSPAAYDTDTDGCSDGVEAADVNGDHKVNSGDQFAIGAHFAAGSLAPNPAYNNGGVRRDELATYDINKDGKIDSGDQLLAAGLFGNCAAGIGAQTALPIVIGTKP